MSGDADCCRTLGACPWGDRAGGAVAQLGEHLLCKQGVSGSIPLSSTKSIGVEADGNEAKASQAQGASPIVWRPRGAPSARERQICLLKK